ncbi:MAG: hypothetical protein ACE5J5_08085 [Candidatus Hydrothermarchaeales archaeon]
MRSMTSIKNWKVDKLLKPETAVPCVYLIFLFFAFLGFRFPATRTFLIGSFSKEPGVLSYILSILAVGIIFVSARYGRELPIRHLKPFILPSIFLITSITLLLAFPSFGLLLLFLSGGFTVLLWYVSTKLDEIGLITTIAIAMAVLSSITILVTGIPIIDVISRESVAVTPSRAIFHGFAVLSATLLIGFYDKKRSILGIAFLATLAIISGFKSDAIAILISAGIAGLLLKRINIREVIILLVSVLFILTAISTHIANISYTRWKIPPLLYIFYRSAFTFSVFDKIVNVSFPLGLLHGRSLLDPAQQIVSTAVLNYQKPHIITSTMVGPGMLDFGVLGVILTGMVIGIFLGVMDGLRNNTLNVCLFSIALVHALILIEVGLQLSSIIFLLSLLYLATGSEARPVFEAVPVSMESRSKVVAKG